MTELLAEILQCSVCGRIAGDEDRSVCDANGFFKTGMGWHWVVGEITCSVCLKIISREEHDIRRGTEVLKRI